MTLISYATNYGEPILMGDLLITSLEECGAPQIPIFLDNVDYALPKGLKKFPQGMKQKIYVIKKSNCSRSFRQRSSNDHIF